MTNTVEDRKPNKPLLRLKYTRVRASERFLSMCILHMHAMPCAFMLQVMGGEGEVKLFEHTAHNITGLPGSQMYIKLLHRLFFRLFRQLPILHKH